MSRSTGFAWHDPRIHWPRAEPPADVRESPDRDHMLGSWRIPASVDGRGVAIEGVIGWSAQPAAEDERAWLVPAALAGGLAAAALLALPVLLRRRPR